MVVYRVKDMDVVCRYILKFKMPIRSCAKRPFRLLLLAQYLQNMAFSNGTCTVDLVL
jgi:hypothetical protein